MNPEVKVSSLLRPCIVALEAEIQRRIDMLQVLLLRLVHLRLLLAVATNLKVLAPLQ